MARSNISTTKALSWTICCHVDGLVGLPKPFICIKCISTPASPHAEQKGNLKKGPSFITVDSWAGVWAENTSFFFEKNKDPEDGKCLLSSKLLANYAPSSSLLSSCVSRLQHGRSGHECLLPCLPNLTTWWHLDFIAFELRLVINVVPPGRDLQNRTFQLGQDVPVPKVTDFRAHNPQCGCRLCLLCVRELGCGDSAPRTSASCSVT